MANLDMMKTDIIVVAISIISFVIAIVNLSLLRLYFRDRTALKIQYKIAETNRRKSSIATNGVDVIKININTLWPATVVFSLLLRSFDNSPSKSGSTEITTDILEIMR